MDSLVSDVMAYIQIHKGTGLVILGIALVVLCATVLAHLHTNGSNIFTNCAQARQAGHSDIPSTSKFYNPALDRNNNSYACE